MTNTRRLPFPLVAGLRIALLFARSREEMPAAP